MDELKDKITEIAENAASGLGLFLIDINLRGNEKNRIVEIFVDSEKHLSAEDLAELSRSINSIFEEKLLFKGSYRLDVSTPGVDRPLKYLEQYSKHIKRNFEIVYQSGSETKNIKARLDFIEDSILTFSTGKSIYKINFNDILNAKVQLSFS